MIYSLALWSSVIGPVDPAWVTPDRPRVEVWTNRGDAVFARGDRARVYFRLDQDAYVAVLRVDTDGRVRMLFPHEPWEDHYARGGRDYEVEGPFERQAFRIDDYPGVGYVFAVASLDPFDFRGLVTADHWDYRVIAEGRVRGDPYVALTEFAGRIVPADYADWDYDIVSYYVERHYDYPRFLCYDCHAYRSWTYWNPYYASCVRFRVVIYDDPWYYPYRYYGGTRVVFVRPYRPQPRFIFRDRTPRDEFVTRVRERPVNDDRRRGVRGSDLGGIGIIPPPRERPRDVRDDDRDDDDDDRERPGRRQGSHGRDRPTRPDDVSRREQPDRPERPDRPDGVERRTPTTRPGVTSLVERGRPTEGRPEGRPDARPAERGRSEPQREARPPERSRAEPQREARPPERSRAEPRRDARSPERSRAEPQREARPPERSRAEPRRDGGTSRPAPAPAPARDNSGGGDRDRSKSREPELRRRP